jgi:hypothetical protein
MTRDQLKQLETDLWRAADNLRQGSDLKSSQYSTPVLGIIFLKFADNNYKRHEADKREHTTLCPAGGGGLGHPVPACRRQSFDGQAGLPGRNYRLKGINAFYLV